VIWLTPEGEQELVETIAGAFTPEDLDFKIADPLKIRLTKKRRPQCQERVGVLVAWAKAGISSGSCSSQRCAGIRAIRNCGD
jgi:hypothetical protein